MVLLIMRIIAIKTLREFWCHHPSAKNPLQAWYADAKQSHWKNPNDIKKIYRNASIVANNRVVFNIQGNDYRLVVAINYHFEIIYIRFVGTHKEYDNIDVTTV
jgi:mRNA interferase HigB